MKPYLRSDENHVVLSATLNNDSLSLVVTNHDNELGDIVSRLLENVPNVWDACVKTVNGKSILTIYFEDKLTSTYDVWLIPGRPAGRDEPPYFASSPGICRIEPKFTLADNVFAEQCEDIHSAKMVLQKMAYLTHLPEQDLQIVRDKWKYTYKCTVETEHGTEELSNAQIIGFDYFQDEMLDEAYEKYVVTLPEEKEFEHNV